jgi:hypothetical protein
MTRKNLARIEGSWRGKRDTKIVDDALWRGRAAAFEPGSKGGVSNDEDGSLVPVAAKTEERVR